MNLHYTVHQDDYHHNRDAFVSDIAGAVAHIERVRAEGFDVDRITLDLKHLYCTRTLHTGAACVNPVEEIGARICIVHRHQDSYNEASRAGRYQGD